MFTKATFLIRWLDDTKYIRNLLQSLKQTKKSEYEVDRETILLHQKHGKWWTA